MASPKDVTLHALFGEQWAPDQPGRLTDLVSADWDTLNEKARGLRALAVHLLHGFERSPVLNAKAAARLLEQHHLPARQGKWVAVALNAERERVYAKAEGGSLRQVHLVSSRIPSPDDAHRKAPLPQGGAYLLIWGGGPDVLAQEQALVAYRDLKASATVVDVLLWDVQGSSADFWSVAAAAGRKDGNVCEWPDAVALDRWRSA